MFTLQKVFGEVSLKKIHKKKKKNLVREVHSKSKTKLIDPFHRK